MKGLMKLRDIIETWREKEMKTLATYHTDLKVREKLSAEDYFWQRGYVDALRDMGRAIEFLIEEEEK